MNTQRIVDTFFKLTSFDSPSYGEGAIKEWLKARLIALGLTVEEDDAAQRIYEEKGIRAEAGNLFATLKGNRTGAPILLSGHMDTVEPSKGKKAILHADGTITSDGTTVLGADDCGGLVAILEALAVIQEEQLPHADIEVLFTVGEEAYKQGATRFDMSKIQSKQSYVFDLSGTIGRAANQAPTMISFTAQFHGKSAHAGFCPEQGVNALMLASHFIEQVQWGRVDEITTCNVGKIYGGKARNIVPDVCTVEGELRSLNDQKAKALLKQIEEVCVRATKERGGEVEFEYEIVSHAYHTPEDSATCQRFIRAVQAAGLTPQLVSTIGGSDQNVYQLYGVQGIVVACAMNAVHSTAEYTSVTDLENTAKIALQLCLQE